MAEQTGSKLRRDAGVIGLLFASLGGIIGSGWLFGPLNAARDAGPASLVAWVIGGVAVLLMAFVYAELATAFPRAGAVVAFPKLSHGSLMATIMSFIVFLGYVSVAPAEASAVITYGNNYIPGLVGHNGVLTGYGFVIAVALMLFFFFINIAAIRIVLTVNSAITWWKLAIPALTVVVLLIIGFHPANLTSHGFAPKGVAGIFSAVATSGVVFAYLGFRQAVELAGESSNPRRNLPIAIVGSVLIAMVLYLGLQIALIGALRSGDLAHGWGAIHFAGMFGPFAGLATLVGATWLAVLLYVDSIVSPAGTAIIFFTTTARVVYATGEEGLIGGQMFSRLSGAGVPVVALIMSLVVGIFFLFPFPSWQKIIAFITSASVLAYGTGPVVFLTLRRTMPTGDYPRPYKLAGGTIIAPLAFIVSNFIIFWSSTDVTDPLFGAVLVFTVIYLAYEAFAGQGLGNLHWRGSWWLAPYFFGIWLITYLGPKTLSHGTGAMSDLQASIVLVAFSLIILWLAMNAGMPDPEEAKASILAGTPELLGAVSD